MAHEVEFAEINAEAQRLAQESHQKYERIKAARNIRAIVGKIWLVGGKVLTFGDYIAYYAAKAFYSKMGAITLAVRSAWETPVATHWPVAVASEERIAKAA